MQDKDLKQLIKDAATQVALELKDNWDGLSDRREQEGGLHPEAVTRLTRIETIVMSSNETTVKILDDHETRVRGLEQKSWLYTGAAGVVGAVGAWFATHFKIGG